MAFTDSVTKCSLFLPISIEKQAKSQATQVLPKRKKRVSTNVLLPKDSCIFSLKKSNMGIEKRTIN